VPADLFDPFTTAVDLAAAIRRRDLRAIEVADAYLARIDRLDPQLNAFCHRADDEVRAAAAAADEVVDRADADDRLPPFLGVPIPIKDLANVAGWPTTLGSAATSREPVAAHDPVVQRFVDAGFVLLGKTTTSELGAVPFTESEVMGITRNPWDPDRSPGGSSSGAGVAVAAGMAPVAHAEDGGGSIRVPAACTGLVGLKPTRGRITNVTVEAEGFATAGVVTRDVVDAAAVLDVLAQHDPAAWWSPPTPARSYAAALAEAAPRGLRIGVMVDSPIEGLPVDPACRAAVDVAVATLEAAGHHVTEAQLPLPSADELVGAITAVWNIAGAGAPIVDGARLEPINQALRAAARATDSWTYAERVHQAQVMTRPIVEAFVTGCDLLLTPTMACFPPPIGTLRTGEDADPMMPLVNSYPMAVFTALFNATGQPAISVPVHHDDATGLPVGVQLAAAPWREDLLLQVARTLEEAHRWTARHPVLAA